MTRDSHYAFQEIMEDSLFVNLSEVAKKNSIINRKRQALGRRLNQALSNKDKNTLKEYGITKNSDIKKVLDKEC